MQKNTPRQIRLMFLMYPWNAVLDYKENAMKEAIGLETTFKVLNLFIIIFYFLFSFQKKKNINKK